jgi:predicted MFS family arabinose efflux permease
MSKARTRVFYGWWIVLVAAVSLFLGPTSIVAFSFGMFLKPLMQEFHSNRGSISLAFTLYSTIGSLGLLFAGGLIDRLGPRKVILVFNSLTGLILVSASFCSGRIWQLYMFYVALGVGSFGVAPVSYCHLISSWFDRYRGLALGMMMSGLGAGALVAPSAAHYLIERFGWRMAFCFSGAAILSIGMPVLILFLKEKPDPMGLMPDGGTRAFPRAKAFDLDSGLSLRQALHTPTLWLLLCVCVLVAGSTSACFVHIASILTDKGFPGQTAAFATSAVGGGLLVGRVGSGYLLDRFFAPRVATLLFVCAATGMGGLRVGSSLDLSFAAAFCIGLGLGAEVELMAYLASRYFGLRSFGSVYGVIFASFGLAAGLGAFLMGAGFDATGSYALPLALCCIATSAGAALMMCLGPYRYARAAIQAHGPELEVREAES